MYHAHAFSFNLLTFPGYAGVRSTLSAPLTPNRLFASRAGLRHGPAMSPPFAVSALAAPRWAVDWPPLSMRCVFRPRGLRGASQTGSSRRHTLIARVLSTVSQGPWNFGGRHGAVMARAQQLAVSVSFYRFAAAHRSCSCQGSFTRNFDIPYRGTMKAKDRIGMLLWNVPTRRT